MPIKKKTKKAIKPAADPAKVESTVAAAAEQTKANEPVKAKKVKTKPQDPVVGAKVVTPGKTVKPKDDKPKDDKPAKTKTEPKDDKPKGPRGAKRMRPKAETVEESYGLFVKYAHPVAKRFFAALQVAADDGPTKSTTAEVLATGKSLRGMITSIMSGSQTDDMKTLDQKLSFCDWASKQAGDDPNA